MKAFRYINGPHFRQVTELHVRTSIEKLPPNAPERAHGAEVLSLAIGESKTFPSGIQWTRIEDDAPAYSALVCNRGGRSRNCQFCDRLVRSGDGLLCDGPPAKPGKKKTCDAFMCRACRKHVGNDRDLCPRCATPVIAAERRQA